MPEHTAEWECGRCHHTVPATFDVCWQCGSDRRGERDAGFVAVVVARSYTYCPRCGYDLRGLPVEESCPECGSTLREFASDAGNAAPESVSAQRAPVKPARAIWRIAASWLLFVVFLSLLLSTSRHSGLTATLTLLSLLSIWLVRTIGPHPISEPTARSRLLLRGGYIAIAVLFAALQVAGIFSIGALAAIVAPVFVVLFVSVAIFRAVCDMRVIAVVRGVRLAADQATPSDRDGPTSSVTGRQ